MSSDTVSVLILPSGGGLFVHCRKSALYLSTFFNINIYSFSKRFYLKRLKLHLRFTFSEFMHSLETVRVTGLCQEECWRVCVCVRFAVPAWRTSSGNRKWPGESFGVGLGVWRWHAVTADTGETRESQYQDAWQVSVIEVIVAVCFCPWQTFEHVYFF